MPLEESYTPSYVPEAIINAQKDSLLHNLTEKIAYGIYQRYLSKDQNSNWVMAQQYFEKWLTGRFGEFIYPLSSFLEKILEFGKESLEEKGQKIDDVKYCFANMIIDINESGHPIIPILQHKNY